jgi:protein TonB
MFEDSTFESTGRIRTRSRSWMLAALCCNSSILLAMILIPLVYPEALPRLSTIWLLEAPAPPPPPVQPRPEPVHPLHGTSEMQDGHVLAPSRIPTGITVYKGVEEAPSETIGINEGIPGGAGDGKNPFFGNCTAPNVRPEVKAPVRVSSLVVAGLLVRKTLPAYPPIARAARQEGTVVLQATISTAGTIENLRVSSGPAMLRQAALDAVQNWRYKPYELNGEPVEVETTVNVVFTLGQ